MGHETIRPATSGDRAAILGLMNKCLGWSDDPRFEALFRWKHEENPFGPSPTWVALDGERVVAVRIFLRWRFRLEGQPITAVRAVDTATDPEYQGRGLFRELTLHALEALTAEGVEFVFNTPNSQSLPGYLKMGWQSVGRLPASFAPTGVRNLARIARSRVPADFWSIETQVGSAPALSQHMATASEELTTDGGGGYEAWRFGLPSLHYRQVVDASSRITFRLRRRGQATELVVVDSVGPGADRLARSTARIAKADYALRLGAPRPRFGFVPLPGGGPTLTWRGLQGSDMPPLPNWSLSMGDVELF